jgi:rod shape-determining protein MreD
VSGAIAGAVAGFVAGLLVDTMTLGLMGFTSILLTLTGYWAGRYGETTGRGRAYAPSLTAFAMTVLVGLAAMALHYLLGDTVSAGAALAPLLPSAVLAAVLVIPVHRICRWALRRPDRPELSREVELV